MGIRKFGTADDQRIEIDGEEDDSARRTAAAADQDGRWTPGDAEALARETAE